MTEKIIIVTEICPACKAAKMSLTVMGLINKVKLVDANSSEGQKFVRKLGIKYVPQHIIVKNNKPKKVTEAEFTRALLEEK